MGLARHQVQRRLHSDGLGIQPFGNRIPVPLERLSRVIQLCLSRSWTAESLFRELHPAAGRHASSIG